MMDVCQSKEEKRRMIMLIGIFVPHEKSLYDK